MDPQFREALQHICEKKDNQVCCDCTTRDPTWVSMSFGSLVCIKCSGVHRGLGAHITRIRSIELDEWSASHIAWLEERGNRFVNDILEAAIPSDMKKPTSSSPTPELTEWITIKYVEKRFAKPGPLPAAMCAAPVEECISPPATPDTEVISPRRNSAPDGKEQVKKQGDPGWEAFSGWTQDLEKIKQEQKEERKRMMAEAKARKKEKKAEEKKAATSDGSVMDLKKKKKKHRSLVYVRGLGSKGPDTVTAVPYVPAPSTKAKQELLHKRRSTGDKFVLIHGHKPGDDEKEKEKEHSKEEGSKSGSKNGSKVIDKEGGEKKTNAGTLKRFNLGKRKSEEAEKSKSIDGQDIKRAISSESKSPRQSAIPYLPSHAPPPFALTEKELLAYKTQMKDRFKQQQIRPSAAGSSPPATKTQDTISSSAPQSTRNAIQKQHSESGSPTNTREMAMSREKQLEYDRMRAKFLQEAQEESSDGED